MKKLDDSEWVEAQKIVISMDLVTATNKHLKFLKAIDKNGNLCNGHVLERAIFRYKYCWLPLLAKHSQFKASECQLVVPLDCEWIWHCHRLNPVRYMADCKELFGIVLDPCGVVISSIEKNCNKETQELWNTLYPQEPYELNLDDYYDINDSENILMAAPSTTYDLVSAVKRQSSFYYQVLRTFIGEDIFLQGAVKRYKGFLHMIKRNMETKSKNFCVPTYDIDLVWHTHQLYPLSYCKDMISLLGETLNHDDTDSDRTKGQKLDVGFSRTTKHWNKMFTNRYWRAGAMYRDMAPVRSRCNDAIQSSKIMFVEILVEIIEIRNLSSNHKGNLVLSISKKQHDMLLMGKKRFSICTKPTEETQAILLECESNGDLLLELVNDSSKSLGNCLLSLSELDSQLGTLKRLHFRSDLPQPITLSTVITTTPPSLVQHMVLTIEENDCSGPSGDYGKGWAPGGMCSGSGGCGGGCGGSDCVKGWATGGMCSGSGGCGGGCGGGGGCRASCGGCRSSCGGGGNCSSK